MIILVNGLMEYGAGKTSVVRAILHRAAEVGEEFVGFKPRSAHNYWEHFDHSQQCASMGMLVSRDALLYQELCKRPPPIELTNPYHQLVCPIDIAKAQEEAEHLLQSSHDQILAERLTHPERGTTLFLNRRASVFVASEEFIDAIGRSADQVQTFETSAAAGEVARVESSVEAALELLAGERPNLVIESFSDTVFPMELHATKVDLVIAVGGSLVLFYEPENVLRADRALGGQSMAELVRYLRATSTLRVPHLTSEERSNPKVLSEAYDPVLRALWSRPRGEEAF